MWESILTQFILLWAVVDPIGSIPVFLVKTQALEKSRRIGVAFRAILVSVGVLLFFIIVGQVLLEAMEIPLLFATGTAYTVTQLIRLDPIYDSLLNRTNQPSS